MLVFIVWQLNLLILNKFHSSFNDQYNAVYEELVKIHFNESIDDNQSNDEELKLIQMENGSFHPKSPKQKP